MKKVYFWEHIVYFWELLYNVYTIYIIHDSLSTLLIKEFRFFCKKRKPRQKVEVTVREFNRNDAKYSNNYIITFL